MRSPALARAFTLLEVLIATAVLVLLLALLSSVTGLTFSTVKRSQSKIDQFSAARAGFERLTATLSQATLNTYWDYVYDSNGTLKAYERKSDLRFLITDRNTSVSVGQEVFFQAPLALGTSNSLPSGLLNAVGYWVSFGGADWKPAFHKPNPYRYRLMEAIQPTEALTVFTSTPVPLSSNSTGFPVAENVIALVLWPRNSPAQDPTGSQLSTNFTYNSGSNSALSVQKAQLPPVVDVTMIVIDEAAAARLQSGQMEPKTITDILSGRFRSVANFEDDLELVRQGLNQARINHLVLSAPVILRESKWSQ